MARPRRPAHGPDCRHCPRVRLLGRDFQGQRAAWEAAREQTTCGYVTERAEYDATHPPPTFKAYLLALAGSGWPMSGSQELRRAA